MSINYATISGNLTRSPELRTTQGGTEVLTIGVAVNDRWKNPQSGEWEDRPNFIDCTMFGKRASSVSRFLSKGMKVCVTGKLRQSTWQDRQTGKNRSKLEVVVDEIEFMSRQNDSQAQSQPQRQQPNNCTNQQQNGPYSAPQQPTGGYEDDLYSEPIPF
jgi:single-strand DNA-binding protein